MCPAGKVLYQGVVARHNLDTSAVAVEQGTPQATTELMVIVC